MDVCMYLSAPSYHATICSVCLCYLLCCFLVIILCHYSVFALLNFKIIQHHTEVPLMGKCGLMRATGSVI